MIVYVESNFVVQLALRQEEADSAEAILEHGRAGKIKLVMPSFSLSEPYSTLSYRAVERRGLYNSLTSQLVQLQRSSPHQQVAAALQQLLSMWADLEKKETDLLQSSAFELLRVGRQLPTSLDVFQQSLPYRDLYGLSLQDAIILSAVISDLRQQAVSEAKCFISSNFKDFGDPGIRAELKGHNCRYISTFSDGLRFVEANLQT